MADLWRIRVVLANFPGAPGVSTFYSKGTPGIGPDLDRVHGFFDALKNYLPSGMTVSVPSEGDVLDDASGRITSSWSLTPAKPLITATGLGNYSGASGAVFTWKTGGVLSGRRVQGRTFFVPLVASQYESNGSLVPAFLTAANTAAAGLYAADSSLSIWHRPTAFTGGSSHKITGHRVPDMAAVLRSRRL